MTKGAIGAKKGTSLILARWRTIINVPFVRSTAEDRRQTRASWDWREASASAVVLACILGAYLYFRG